jgi:hypothetical protein
MEERRYYRIERPRRFLRTWLIFSGVMFCVMSAINLWDGSPARSVLRDIPFSVLCGAAAATGLFLRRNYSVAVYSDRLESHGLGIGRRTVFRNNRLRVYETKLGLPFVDRHRGLAFTNRGRFSAWLYGLIFIPESVEGYEQLRSEFLPSAGQSSP